jgi:hypothetical protein
LDKTYFQGYQLRKKVSIFHEKPCLGLILAFLDKNTALRAVSILIRVWGIRFSEQNFYFTSIYMLTRDRKNEGIFFRLLKLASLAALHFFLLLEILTQNWNFLLFKNCTLFVEHLWTKPNHCYKFQFLKYIMFFNNLILFMKIIKIYIFSIISHFFGIFD